MNLKENKGIGLSDAIIAIAIFVIFSGVVISISYNIYLQSNFIKRNDTATNYIVEVFEHAKSLDLDSLINNLQEDERLDSKIENVLINFINDKPENTISATNDETISVSKGYVMQIFVHDISNNENTEYDENLIEQIDVSVSYTLGGKTKTVSMSTLLTK